MNHFPASTATAARLAYSTVNGSFTTGDAFTDLLTSAPDKDVLLAFAEVSMAMVAVPGDKHLPTRWNLLLVEAQARMAGHPAAAEVQ